MVDQTLWLSAGVIIFLQTLDTLRRYFTAKKRWSFSTLVTQLLLLPSITIAGLIFVLKVALPMLVKPIGG
jgi:hypothetical protein